MALTALGALLLSPLLAGGGSAAATTATSSGSSSAGPVLTSAHLAPDPLAKKKKVKKKKKKKVKKKKKAAPAPAVPPAGYVMGAATRTQEAPNVTYPVSSDAKPTDKKSFTTSHPGTEIRAACGTSVRSIHPGTVNVLDVAPWGGSLVKVTTSVGRLTTWFGYLADVSVTDGQIVSAGQPLGVTGSLGDNTCGIHLEIRNGESVLNPTTWLETYVGKPLPDLYVFDSYGFTLASFNQLGASHTAAKGDNRKYPGWATRTPKSVAYVKSHSLEVVGMQEFQKKQFKLFMQQAPEYAAATAGSDTENAIIWRKDAFDLVEQRTFAIPYFNGRYRAMPYVLLKQKSTGRTAWFINVHNPANTKKYKNQGGWRAQAIAIERQLVVDLRAQDRPVFLTGDLNDREAAYCPLAQGKLMVSADTVPSIDCQPPKLPWIDWIMAAGQARFATYYRDYSTRTDKISDHPAVYGQAFLAE